MQIVIIGRVTERGGITINKIKLPIISILLMAIFIVGGSLVLVVKWPPGPANLDWGVWLLAYFGYVYLIAASIYYVKKGK